MNPVTNVIHALSGLFGQIPEWAPHDHTLLGRNVPLGHGVENRIRVPEWLPHNHDPHGRNVPVGHGVEAYLGMPFAQMPPPWYSYAAVAPAPVAWPPWGYTARWRAWC